MHIAVLETVRGSEVLSVVLCLERQWLGEQRGKLWSRFPLSGCPQGRKKPHTTAPFLLSIGDASSGKVGLLVRLGKMDHRPKYKDKTTKLLRESREGNISNLWLGKHRYNTKSHKPYKP